MSNISRRHVLSALGGLALTGSMRQALSASGTQVRVGFTPAFVLNQYALLADWREYMEQRLGVSVEFVQRDSYQETMDLIRLKQIDFAWVCDYPYLYLRNMVRLLAVPLYKGQPYYRSFIIVASGNSAVRSLGDLKNTVFAYADPLSNSGYFVPRFRLHQLGEDPRTFFHKTFFTWSHKNVIEAVAIGMAQGGAVDSFVWETLNLIEPKLTRATRIVERSPEFGFPPFVAHHEVAPQLFSRVQNILLAMPQDPQGASLVKRLNLDGFIKGNARLYDSLTRMMRAFGEG